MAPPIESIKAALDPNFQYDPDSQYSYEEQLEAYQNPELYKSITSPTGLSAEDVARTNQNIDQGLNELRQMLRMPQKEKLRGILQSQELAGQHTDVSDTADIETAQSIRNAAKDIRETKQTELQQAVASLNNPNTSDEELVYIYENVLQDHPEAKLHFQKRFPNLVPPPTPRVSAVEKVLSDKEQIAVNFTNKLQAKKLQIQNVKQEAAVRLAKSKFGKQPVPLVTPRTPTPLATANIGGAITPIDDPEAIKISDFATPGKAGEKLVAANKRKLDQQITDSEVATESTKTINAEIQKTQTISDAYDFLGEADTETSPKEPSKPPVVDLDTRDPGEDRRIAEKIQAKQQQEREYEESIKPPETKVDKNTFATAKDKLMDSIYVAEGGPDARIPYGMFTKDFEDRIISGEDIPEEEVRSVVSKHLDRHISLWESNKTRNIEGAEERGLVNANPDKTKAFIDGKWNEDFLKWYGEIYAPVDAHPLNKNWIKNVTSGVDITPPQSEFKTKKDPTLEVPDTPSPVYGAPPAWGVHDPSSKWAPSSEDSLAQALYEVPDPVELGEALKEPDYMKQTSPVVETDGVVTRYQNGTWSTTVNGVTLPGLDEVTARSFAAYTAANERAIAAGAPRSTLGNYFNMFMQSWAIPSEMAASAFTGPITLTAKVSDYNSKKRSQPLLNDPSTDISDEDVQLYTSIQEATELDANQKTFKNTAKYRTIEKLHAEAKENRAQLDNIHLEADKYRDKFPVNDADFQGALAAAEVIARNQGTEAAMWNAVKNDLGTYIEQGIGSIGFMVALTAGGPPVQLAMLSMLAKGRANQAIAEFQDREERDPTEDELFRLNWASAAGIVAEKVSAGVLVKVIGKVPGVGGQLAWVKKVKGAVDKTMKGPVKTYTDSLLHRGVVAPIGGLASEASQGAATSYFEQVAQTGKADIEEVKMAAFQEAVATPGAAAGMMATSGAYRTAKGGVKFVMDPRGRRRNKAAVLKEIDRVEAQLNSDDPVLFGETDESKPVQDQLKEVEDQIQELKDKEGSSVVLERAIEEQQRLIGILEAPASGDQSAQVIKEKETYLNKLKQIRDTEDYSKKSESRDKILEGSPLDGTAISKEELDKTLKDLDLTKYESTREKLVRLSKRALTPENKRTVLSWLDKSIDRTVSAAETVGIFGSLEDSLDPDKLSLEDLKKLRAEAKEIADQKFLNSAIALRELKERLLAEAQETFDKDLAEVDVEALEGKSSRWKGLDTYRQEILDIYNKYTDPNTRTQALIDRQVEVVRQKMVTHANNLQKKLSAFADARKRAQNNPAKEGYVWAVKGNRDPNAPKDSRVMEYTVSETQMPKTEFDALRKKGEFIWEINAGKGSAKLINTLKLEANFGKAAVATVDNYKKTSIKQRKDEKQVKLEQDAVLVNMLAEIRDAVGEPVKPVSQEDIDKLGDTDETAEQQEQPQQGELFPEGELPDRVTPVSEEAPKAPKRTTQTPPKPGETGYQSTLFDEQVEQVEDQVEEEPPTKTVVENFITTAKQAYESVITENNINPKTIKSNLENLLGLVGAFFLDLVDIDTERPEGIHTLQDTDFVRDKAGNIDIRPLRKALKGLGMNTANATQLAQRYKEYDRRYRDIAHKDLDKSGNPVENYAIRQPLSILLRKDANGVGKLPDQVVFGMMVGTLRWTDENTNNSPFRNERQRKAFMYEDESPLAQEDIDQMTELGFSYQQATSSVGRNIARMLAMSQKKASELDSRISKEGASIYYENLRIALGLAAFEIAHGNVDGTQKTVDGKSSLEGDPNAIFQIKKHIWDFKEDNVDGRHFNNSPKTFTSGSKKGEPIPEQQQEGYKHIVINKESTDKPNPKDKKALEELVNILDQEMEEDSHHPLKDPPSVSSFIKGTMAGRIPRRVQRTMKKLQNVVWSKAEALDIYAKLNKHGHKETLYQLADVKEYGKTTHHKNEQQSLEASNQDKRTAIDEVLDSYNAERLDRFHFKYELQNHHRIMMQGRLNPQNSKVTRFLVQSWGPKQYNEKNLWKFKLAVAHLFEFKVDKQRYPASEAQFNKIIEDPQVIKAISVLINLEKGVDEKQNAKKLADLLIELKETYGVEHGTSLINGLTALARYMPDGKPKTKFESDVVFEIDGITNGFAMNVLQFPLFGTNLEKILNQIGVYFGKDNIHDPKASDVYEDLIGLVQEGAEPEFVLDFLISSKGKDFKLYGKKWEKKHNEFMQAYTRKNDAIMRLYPDFKDGNLRSLVKYPFLIFMYGGGITSISEGISKDIVKEMYKELGRHVRIYKNLQKEEQNEETKKQLAQLEKDYGIKVDTHTEYGAKVINEFLNDLKELGALTDGQIVEFKRTLTGDAWTEFQLNDTAMIKNIADTLAPRFDHGLNSMLGETKEARDAVVQAGEIMHAVFKAHYDVAYEKALIIPANKERGTPEYKRKSLTRQEIIDLVKDTTSGLIKVYPQYAGPLSSILKDGSIEGFVDLTKTETTDKKNIPEFVEFVHQENGKKKLATSAPSQLDFVAPGVSALIRQIINMDSVLLTQTLETDPQLLMLHDAFMGSPEQLSAVMETYGKLYLDYGMKHSVFETTVNQLNKVLEITKNTPEIGQELIGKIDTWLQDNAFANENVGEEKIKGLFDLVENVEAQLKKVKAARKDLNDRKKKEGWQAFQMFMAAEEQVEDGQSFVDQKMEEVEQNVEKFTKVYKKRKIKRYTGDDIDIFQDGILTAIAKLGGISRFSKDGKKQFGDFKLSDRPSYKDAPSGLGTGWPAFRIDSGGKDVDDIRSALQELKYLTNPDDTDEIFDKVQEEIANPSNKQKPVEATEAEIRETDYGAEYEAWSKEQEEEGQESLNNLPRSNEKTLIDGSINKSQVVTLFETMKKWSNKYYSSKEDMDEHTSTLSSILSTLTNGMDEVASINFELEQIDGITQGQYVSARNKFRVSVANQPPLANNTQSPLEVYVHEFLHAMTATVLNDRPLIASRIANLYEQTEKNLNSTYGTGQGYKVFLEGIANPSVNDKEMAKKQYRYLFDNPKRESNKLHEFLAYAVTNQSMIKFLKNQEVPKRSGLLGKLLDAVTAIVDAFREIMGFKAYRSKDGSAHMEMVAIMEHLVAIKSKHQSLYQQLSSKAYDTLDKSDLAIQNFADDQTRKFNSRVKTKLEFLTSVVKGVPIVALSNHASALWVRNQITKGLNKTLRGIANEIGSGSLSADMIEQLLQAKVNVSKARQESERYTIRWFNGDEKGGIESIWKSVDPTDKHSMPVKTKEALTEVLLKTDLSSLRMVGVSTADIVKLIGKSASAEEARKKQKTDLVRLLKAKQPTGLRPALLYAEELGYHIATGRTKRRKAHMNAYSIAQEFMTTPDKESTALLDAYATLAALDHVDSRSSSLVRTLADNEFAADVNENGIIDILDSHLVFKEESIKDLFKDNPMQSVKGYIVERVDNLTSVKTGTAADKEKMRKEGYTESYSLGKIDQSSVHDTLYVSRNMPEVADVSGIMSTTNQRNMGTTLTEILLRDPKYQYTKGPLKGQPNFIKIKGAVRKFIAKQDKIKDLSEDKKMQQLRPVRDDTGRITDYRVMTDYQTKKEILRPDLEIQNVFAHMRSGLVDRRATLDNDMTTVELLVHEQMDMMESNPDLNWVDLMDPESPYIDRYRKLPRQVREYMKSFAVDGKFLVREDIVDKVFGYKQFDVTQLKVFQDDAGNTKLPRVKYFAGLTHYMIRQIVGYGKDRVVIAMPQVVIGNMMSNVSQLMMRKIPIEYILYKVYEGIREYGRYQKDTDERVQLLHKIKSKNLDPDNSSEAMQVQRLNARIEGNKLHKMTAAGLNSLIVEDINDATIDGYFNRMRRLLKLDKYAEYVDKVPTKVGDIASTLFMTKSSKPYQLARHTVQLTDFLGRYVMMEHAVNVKGQDFKTAMHDALNAFVLFDEALVPALEAVDAVGATSFISYYLRNARASKQLVQSSPTSVGLSAITQHATGISTLGNVNSSWIGGKFTPNTLQLDDLFDEANNVTLVDIVGDATRDIFS